MIKFVVFGNLPRKSNSRRIFKNRRTGCPIIVKSQEALNYERSFASQVAGVPRGTFGEKDGLSLTAHIFYSSRRPDLSDELICDLLEKTGIIHNDRQIVHKTLIKGLDRDNPRVEVEVREYVS